MTQEEKAKAYDEALERAKKFNIDDAYASQGATIKSIFPELRESEDERIRKWLYDLIDRMSYDNLTKEEAIKNENWKKRVLAYLEKQKEQKLPNGCFTCDEYKKGYEEGRRNGFTAGYNKAMKEVEQKEQKPAEWSEEDNNTLEYLHELIDFGFTENFFDAQTAADMREWLNTRLKSLRPSWKPSEEQMKEPEYYQHFDPDC